uniref:Lysosome membrane protein 2-like n=1 Tax=Sphaeramia orbicularis TaxID=375764 RepID=A0A673A8C7_9TELE
MLLKSCCIYSTGIFSILMLILGISLVLSNVFPHFLQGEVEKEVVLKNGTEAFDAFENPPAPIYMQFYFFNLTNPLEMLNGDRPAVVEIGPYTYREYRPMEDVNFQENGTKVAAVNPKTYIFQRNMSRGPETDLIRTVNIPAMTVMEKFKDNALAASVISSYMRSQGEGLFITRTVRELLWGYEDGLLKALSLFQPGLDDVFGLFYKNNGSNDGKYVFFTGQGSSKDFARVDTWNGNSSLDWWTSDECNMINGTNGAFFHPVVTKNETLYMFSSDLCRSLYAVYEEDVTVKGIPGYRFTPPSKVFANLTVNPDNAGFCVPAGNCLGSGLLNVSACKQGAPIIMSSPHFYQADEKFVKDVFGMNPKKEEHQTTIDINPVGNLNIDTYTLHVLLFSVLIDDASAVKLRTVMVKQNVVVNIPFMLIGLGIIMGVLFMFLMCRQKVPESTAAERQPLLSS